MKKKFDMSCKKIIFLIIFFVSLGFVQNTYGLDELKKQVMVLANKIPKNKTVATSFIYNIENGNVTPLGNYIRDIINDCLVKKGIRVKVRKDLYFIMDDIDSFGDLEGSDLWNNIKADILILGGYFIWENLGNRSSVEIIIKTVKLSSGAILDIVRWKGKVNFKWVLLDTKTISNVYQNRLKTISPIFSNTNHPLHAALNKNPPCYYPGEEVKISVKTVANSYIYIFAIQSDGTVVMVYPNKKFPGKPIKNGKFVFPIDESQKLVVYPDKNSRTKEAFKIVVSKKLLNFDFLPVCEDKIYKGADGGSLKKLVDYLSSVKNWNEELLPYWVGEDCKP